MLLHEPTRHRLVPLTTKNCATAHLSLCAAGATVIERTTLPQTPEALAQWANVLRTRFPNGKIALCLEQARGALLAGLMQYEHIVPYPVNPKTLARFREALYMLQRRRWAQSRCPLPPAND